MKATIEMNPHNRNARVFIAEPVSDRYDIRGAKEHGHIVYLYEPNFEAGDSARVNAFDVTQNVRHFMKRLDELKYDPDQDFICMTGHNMVTAALLTAASMDYEEVRLLAFNSANKNYFVIDADLSFPVEVEDA